VGILLRIMVDNYLDQVSAVHLLRKYKVTRDVTVKERNLLILTDTWRYFVGIVTDVLSLVHLVQHLVFKSWFLVRLAERRVNCAFEVRFC